MTGKELLTTRHAFDFSQEELGHLLGVTGRTVYKWEKEVTPIPRSVEILLTLHRNQRIARRINMCLLDCRIDWML